MLVYLKPLSIFPELHSDTIFGAITYAVSQLYPDKVESMVERFKQEDTPFLVSSAFPYIGDKIRFYPKINLNGDNREFLKRYKKVEFVQEDIFRKIINNEINDIESISNCNFIDNLLTSPDLDEDFRISRNIVANNSINRLTNETNEIFYTTGKQFINAGLFFHCKIIDEDYREIIEASLRFLKDRGFGRDISTGKGQFDFEIEQKDLDDIFENSGDKFISLSRFIPSGNDLKHIRKTSSYEISSKRGRSQENEIRKQIRFFTEGSVFPAYSEIYGKIVESGKVNPAVEYGFAFPLRFGGD